VGEPNESSAATRLTPHRGRLGLSTSRPPEGADVPRWGLVVRNVDIRGAVIGYALGEPHVFSRGELSEVAVFSQEDGNDWKTARRGDGAGSVLDEA
jgi:hypothetical protein